MPPRKGKARKAAPPDPTETPTPAKKAKPTNSDSLRRSSRAKQQFVPFAGSSNDTPKTVRKVVGKMGKTQNTAEVKTNPKKRVPKGKVSKKNVNKVAKGKVTKKSVKKEKVKKDKAPRTARDKNAKLTPRPDFIAREHNRLHYDKGEVSDDLSELDAVRLAHLYVTQKRLPELKKLLAKPKLFPFNGPTLPYASGDPRCITEIAAETGDITFFENVVAAIEKTRSSPIEQRRNLEEDCILRKLTSGRANIHMLGHRTRAIEAGRGSRQGNNALIIHDVTSASSYLDAEKLINDGCTFEMLEAGNKVGLRNGNLANKVVNAVRVGNRKLAAELIKAYASYNFNDLHTNTLTIDKGELPKFMPISVTKKAQNNKNITPVHTAAINPNANILKTVLKFEYDANLADTDGWHTLHYAAVCDGSGPLSHLLSVKTPLTALNKQKESALHAAARVGRLENVKLLVEAAKKEGISEIFINAKNSKGYTPIHLAVENGRIDIVKYFLENPDVKPEIPTVSSSDKLTPLMTATRKGNLEIVRLLIDVGKAFIDAGDRFKRTPLIHAVLSGQDHILTELLARGASVTTKPDSSGNTTAHYAAAYGWEDDLLALYQADPDSMVVKNAWHLSPMMVAYLKGHFDIVDWFITSDFEGLSSEISVDDSDIEGVTLLMHVVKSGGGLDKQAVEAVQYLLKHKADLKVKNAQGETAFLLLADQAVKFVPDVDPKGEKLTEKEYLELVSLLSNNFDSSIITSASDTGKTPLNAAISVGNFSLASKLLQKSGKQYIETWKSQTEGNTIIHDLLDGASKVSDQLIDSENSNDKDKEIALATFEACDPVPVFETVLKLLKDAKLLKKYTEARDGKGVPALIKAVWIARKIKVENPDPKKKPKQQYGMFFQPNKTPNTATATTVEKILEKLVAIVEQLVIANKESVLLEVSKQAGDETSENSDKPDSDDNDDDESNATDDGEGETQPSAPASEPEEAPMEVDVDPAEQKQYSPNAFEYTIRYKEPTSKGKTFQLIDAPNATKFDIPNSLIEVIIKNIKDDIPLLKKVLTKVDRRFGFNGLTPFLFCLENGYVNAAAYILKTAEAAGLSEAVLDVVWEGVSFDFGKTVTRFQKHPLLMAVEKRYVSLFDYIAKTSKIASTANEKGQNALHYLAKSNDDVAEHMEALMKRGIRLTTDSLNRHPLHYATAAIQASRSTDVCPSNVDFLLTEDPKSVATVDSLGRTPLHAALVGLVDKIEDFDFNKVANFDPIVIVSPLLRRMTPDQIALPDALGNTAVHYAAMAGAHVSLTLLLEHSVDVNVTNSLGNTPIGYAVALKRETAAMQFILLKAAIGTFYTVTQKQKPRPETTELPVWKVGPQPVVSNGVPEVEEEHKAVPILEHIVTNDWQAIVHVILDLFDDDATHVTAVIDLISAAVARSRKNLLQVLLKRLTTAINRNQTNGPEVQIEASKRAFESFSKSATGGSVPNVILGLLFDAGLTWNFESAEILAKRGEVALLNEIHDHDAESTVPQWEDFKKSDSHKRVLIHLLHFWKNTGSGVLKKFILDHYSWETLDSCLDFYPDAANAAKVTPLSYAITEKKVSLIKFLVQEADVDRGVPDAKLVTPFMKAVASNDVEIIKNLVKKGTVQGQAHPSRADFAFTPFGSTATPSGSSNVNNLSTFAAPVAAQGFSSRIHSGGTAIDTINAIQFATKRAASIKAGAKSLLKRRKQSEAATSKATINGTDNEAAIPIDADFIIDNVDSNGRNAIHYLVESGHENIDLLKKLYTERPNQIPYMIIEETSAGTPYSLALKLRQKTLLAEFQRILKAAKVPNHASYNHKITPFSIESEISKIPKPIGDVEADSAAFLDSQRTKIAAKAKPDPRKPFRLCQNTDNGEIVVDEDTGRLYKALMHKTDLLYGYTGLHNFYRVELVQRKRSDLYVLFTHWGRIGDSHGQFQHTPFSDRAAAVKEFKSVYRQKTGNDFDAEEFIEKKDKYRLVDAPDGDYVDLAELEVKLVKGLPDKEADQPYIVIRDISNVDLLKRKWKAVNSNASSSVPFGRASKEKLLQARKLLSELQKLAENPYRRDGTDRLQLTSDQIIEKLQKQYKLSSEFFMTLLLGNYAFEKLPVIDNNNIINQYSKIIDQFFEIENGALLVAAAAQRQPAIDPYRYILSALDSKLEIIDQYGQFAQMVLRGIANQTPDVKVTGIFEILSRSAAQNFVSKPRANGTHRYLWHGTRAENLLSILKVGLVVTPAHALWNGAMFGEGIYLADTIAKARNYASDSAGGHKYVLICEVSVDKVKTLENNDPLENATADDVKDVDMVIAPGQQVPDPKDDVTTPEGIRFSRGALIQRDAEFGMYNWRQPQLSEYVVKDRANVLPRYLVRFS
uniref:Poly [ADP-ribose] polymerase n=1 Tax=Panagrellus redivivus TaxID=6233 RepID=A0A7E4UQ68_PANRE